MYLSNECNNSGCEVKKFLKQWPKTAKVMVFFFNTASIPAQFTHELR
jgi:hypothetical protein